MGSKENEWVDELERQAANASLIGPELFGGAPKIVCLKYEKSVKQNVTGIDYGDKMG